MEPPIAPDEETDEPRGRALAFRGRDGLGLAAEAFGAPGDPPVLLLHGGGQTRHAWGGTARALAEGGWYAVCLDARGHGDSEWCKAGDYGADAFAADLSEVVAQFDTPPALVGASLGGITALLAVGEAQLQALGLVLVDIAPRMEVDGVDRILSFMSSQPDGYASLDEVADAIAAYLPHRKRPRDISGLQKNLRRHADGRWRWRWDPAFLGSRQPAVSRSPERLVAAARALSLPTLLVRGRLSDLLSEQGAREFLELAPHAEFVDVSGAGHMVAGDRNDVFTRAVLGFLERLREGPTRQESPCASA